MPDNFPNEIINQVNVSSHVEQWMKSNQSFDATRSLTDETEALNRQTDRHVKQGIVEFADKLGIQIQTRFEKNQAWEEQEELGRQWFRGAMDSGKTLGSAGVKEHTNNQFKFADNDFYINRALGKSTNNSNAEERIRYHNTHTAKPSRLTDTKISMAMHGLGPYLDKSLSDPTRVWTLPDGNKFHINNWSSEEAEWAREQEILNYLQNNGQIDLTKVNLAYLTPYLKNMWKNQEAWQTAQSAAIAVRDSKILRGSEFNRAVLTTGSSGDMGNLLEVYRFTTDAKGNPLGRVGAMEQLKADLIEAVSSTTLTASRAFEVIYKNALGHRWKGTGKTLAEEYPRYSVNTVEGQAFHKQLMDADNKATTVVTKYRKNQMDKKVQALLSSECGMSYNPTCIQKFKELQTEANNIEGYSTTSIDKWLTRSETIASDGQIVATKAALDAAIQGDFFFPDTKIGGTPVRELINSLPAADQKAYWTALGKPEIFENDAFKNNLKGMEEIVRSATKDLDSNAVKAGNSRDVVNELKLIYKRAYRKFMASEVGPIDPATKKPSKTPYTVEEAASAARQLVQDHWEKNGGTREAGDEKKRYYVSFYGENYANFGNFTVKNTAEPVHDPIGTKTNVAVDNLLKSGLYTKDSILDNNDDIIFTENKLKEIKNRFENQSGYLIPKKVRGLSLQLGVNPIHLINRQLKAYGIPLLESPITPWFEDAETARLEALNRNATPENSIRFLHKLNERQLDISTIPYSRHFSEKLPNDQKPFAGALIDIMNKDGGTNMQDVKDTEEIIGQFTLADGSLDVPNFMNTLESLGINVQDYKRELYKYLGRSAFNRATMPLRPNVQRIFNQELQQLAGTP